jgi:hypothetical protein
MFGTLEVGYNSVNLKGARFFKESVHRDKQKIEKNYIIEQMKLKQQEKVKQDEKIQEVH